MKNLIRFTAVVLVSSLFSSCGAPMAALRTVQNTARTAMSVAGY